MLSDVMKSLKLRPTTAEFQNLHICEPLVFLSLTIHVNACRLTLTTDTWRRAPKYWHQHRMLRVYLYISERLYKEIFGKKDWCWCISSISIHHLLHRIAPEGILRH